MTVCRRMKFRGFFGFDNGIVLAPMGFDVAGPELVAAVANSGGIGLLATPLDGYDVAVEVIRRTKKLTRRPFGAGVLLPFDATQAIKAVFDEKLPLLQVFWGDFPKAMVDEAHNRGVKVLHQVGTVERAAKAIAAGVDGIIAQGVEAGGHVEGTTPLNLFLPQVLDMVRASKRNIAVIAAGAICDGRGYAAALAMGADGICMGTRFVATEEAYANDYYKQQLLRHRGDQSTDLTDLYHRHIWRGPVRCLNTPFHQKWRNAPQFVENDTAQPIIGYTTIYGKTTEMRRFDGRVPTPATVGDLDSMCLLSGQGVGLIEEILPVKVIMKKIIDDAAAIIQNPSTAVTYTLKVSRL